MYQLSEKKQLREARGRDDDWTGLTDGAERRRRQNRLHQRAWRRRRAAESVSASGSTETSANNTSIHNPSLTLLAGALQHNGHSTDPSMQRQVEDYREEHPHRPPMPRVPLQPFSYWERVKAELEADPRSLPLSRLSSLALQHLLMLSGDYLYTLTRTPRLVPPLIPYLPTNAGLKDLTSFLTPLSADHKLIVMVQYNVLRAVMTNMAILSLLHRLPLECGGALNIDMHPAPKDIPLSLRPTPLQEAMPHDPWINCFPSPAMRDNLLLNRGAYDEDELCCDVMGGLYEGFDDVHVRGMLVWGDPWDPSAWEISEGFATKWGFLLKGCHETVQATQRFREERGEDRLVVEV